MPFTNTFCCLIFCLFKTNGLKIPYETNDMITEITRQKLMDITLILHFSHTLFCKLPKTITFDKARKTIKTNVAVMFLGNGTLTFYIKSILTLKEKSLKTQP